MGASWSWAAAFWSFLYSSWLAYPRRILWMSTRARAQSRRCTSDSFDISRLKTAMACRSAGFRCTATFSAMFIAKLVFPIEGRPAITTKSDFWNPAVISSRS